MTDTLVLTALTALALTLFGEARGEPVEGRIAVACVIRNRLQLGRWGTTYDAICRAHDQFSCWNADNRNRPLLLAHAAAIANGEPVTDPILRECLWIAQGCMDGDLTPRVGDATHYYAITIATVPAWATGAQLVARVGHHLFFRVVR